MKKTFILFSAATLMMAVACNKENSAPEVSPSEEGRVIHLTLQATKGEADDTKTTMSYGEEYGSLSSVWAAGDQIHVYSIKSGEELSGSPLTLVSGSITNQVNGSNQWPTSYASFEGNITLGEGDKLTDNFRFVYQGSGINKDLENGVLKYDLSTGATAADIKDMNKWDWATGSGKIQKSGETASAAVSFTNRMAFGYFTTVPVASETDLQVNYYKAFEYNPKTDAISATEGTVTIPGNKAFYMALVSGKLVKMATDKQWDSVDSPTSYTVIDHDITFTASQGNYYRLGASSSYGPVPFKRGVATTYKKVSESYVVSNDGTTTVHFTAGNLQYVGLGGPGTEHYEIASDQFTVMANATSTVAGGYFVNNAYLGEDANKYVNVNLFSWGNLAAPFYSNETYSATNGFDGDLFTDGSLYLDYASGISVDKVSGVNKYRILTRNEWVALFNKQAWGFATVTDDNNLEKCGIFVLPLSKFDEQKVNGVTVSTKDATKVENAIGDQTLVLRRLPSSTSGTANIGDTVNKFGDASTTYKENELTREFIESNGILFLPVAGFRSSAPSVSSPTTNAIYWSSTEAATAGQACNVNFSTTYGYSSSSNSRARGYAVRLVY